MRRILSHSSKFFYRLEFFVHAFVYLLGGKHLTIIFLVIDLWHILLWHAEGLAVNHHHDVAATCCFVGGSPSTASPCVSGCTPAMGATSTVPSVWCVVLPGASTLSSAPPGTAVLLSAPRGTTALLEELDCWACSPRSSCLKNFFVSCSLWCCAKENVTRLSHHFRTTIRIDTINRCAIRQKHRVSLTF